MKKKKAIITGINGQDGSYLAEYLLGKGYDVYGVVRRSSLELASKMENILIIKGNINLLTSSLENSLSVYKLFSKINPDECYHLAASSFVSYNLEDDLSIMTNNFTVTHNILSAILEVCPKCKVYFAGSSEIFGEVESFPQNEETTFNPRSVYGISKLSSHYLIKNYRKRFGIYACTGFAYNHESPRRGMEFVTRKISNGVAKVILGKSERLELGNLNTSRDWGYAPEYVQAMYKMLNENEEPRDYVIATGKLHTIRELLEIAFNYVGLNYKKYVHVNESLVRPGEEVPLVGDTTKIYKDLGWIAKKDFKEMIREMVDNDVKQIKMSSE